MYICIYSRYVGSTVGRYNTNIPNIDKILTNIGHRFVHQTGLDESSGQKSTIFPYRIAFRVYLMFSNIGQNTKCSQILTKTHLKKKGMSIQNKTKKHLRQA